MEAYETENGVWQSSIDKSLCFPGAERNSINLTFNACMISHLCTPSKSIKKQIYLSESPESYQCAKENVQSP
jgi:hypothetical protein